LLALVFGDVCGVGGSSSRRRISKKVGALPFASITTSPVELLQQLAHAAHRRHRDDAYDPDRVVGDGGTGPPHPGLIKLRL
jgi:hypothetical protein